MADEQPTTIALPMELMNQIVDFLQRQPYGSVAGIIDAIKNEAKPVNLEEPSHDGPSE